MCNKDLLEVVTEFAKDWIQGATGRCRKLADNPALKLMPINTDTSLGKFNKVVAHSPQNPTGLRSPPAFRKWLADINTKLHHMMAESLETDAPEARV